MPGFVEPPSKAGVTRLLKAWSGGDEVALEKLTSVVENELYRVAHRCVAREKPGHILQSAALVNEVCTASWIFRQSAGKTALIFSPFVRVLCDES